MDTKSLIGTRLTDKAFISTGILEPLTVGRNVFLSINVPKGTRGLYLYSAAHTKYKNQHEVLLGRGYEFAVKNADIENGKIYLEVDLINDGNDSNG